MKSVEDKMLQVERISLIHQLEYTSFNGMEEVKTIEEKNFTTIGHMKGKEDR